jgi:hypothetical protein
VQRCALRIHVVRPVRVSHTQHWRSAWLVHVCVYACVRARACVCVCACVRFTHVALTCAIGHVRVSVQRGRPSACSLCQSPHACCPRVALVILCSGCCTPPWACLLFAFSALPGSPGVLRLWRRCGVLQTTISLIPERFKQIVSAAHLSEALLTSDIAEVLCAIEWPSDDDDDGAAGDAAHDDGGRVLLFLRYYDYALKPVGKPEDRDVSATHPCASGCTWLYYSNFYRVLLANDKAVLGAALVVCDFNGVDTDSDSTREPAQRDRQPAAQGQPTFFRMRRW